MEMLQYSFMQRAVWAGIVVGIICPLIGMFLVLRRFSMIGDALAHVSLAGVALGLVAGVNPTILALAFSGMGALAIEYLHRFYHRYAEISLAIIIAAGMSAAVILLSLGRGTTATVTSFLFGSVVTLSRLDIYIITAVGLTVTGLVFILHRRLFYICFDEEAARVAGIPVSGVNFFFTLLVAMTAAVSMRIVGSLLVSSLMIIPVAAALQVGRSFRQALAFSVVSALTSAMAGITLAFYLDLPPGAAIVLVSLVVLVITILTKRLLR